MCTNGNNTLKGEKKTKPAPIGESGKPLSYTDTNIHRIVNGFIAQGGDMVFGNGSGGESIFNGKKFKDERAGLLKKHDKRGIVSMGNSGKNSNTSQFFITFKEASQCDGKHVIFGEVISGFDALDAMEEAGTSNGEPKVQVKITACGAFHALQTPGSGYWYDQPDAESFTGKTPVFMVRPRVGVIAPTQGICNKFIKMLGSGVTCTCIAVDDIGSEDAAVTLVHELLSSFSIDAILVAPPHKSAFQGFEIPQSWSEAMKKHNRMIEKDQICLIAKPLEALSTIQDQSWLSKVSSYQLDGKI